MEHSFLFNAIVYLSAAVIAVPLSKRLGLGSILGYLIAGSILGPWGLSLVRDVEGSMHFGELGVVFLMFLIGLELQLSRVWEMRRAVFGMGAAQMGLTSLIIALLGIAVGLSPVPAVVVGIGLSLSSTAFALQLLAERNELKSAFGQLAFAILLFQDVAVAPLLAILPLLSERATATNVASPVVIAATILAIVFGGRYLLRPILRAMAWTHAREIFTAASLLLVLGIAAVMQAIGLSMALGAFLAGVLLADSEYRHELEADLEPFKGLLLGLFFISVGMSVDYGLLVSRPTTVVLGTVLLLVVKTIVLGIVGKLAKLNEPSTRALAVSISQGGEFAFVLFGIASASGLMDPTLASLLVLVVALSMALTPLLVKFNDKVLSPWRSPDPPPFDDIKNEQNPVIIAGYGRVGQIAARILRVKGIGFTALEHDPQHVEVVRRFGQRIYYGDASRLDLLEAAGAKHAKVFILAIDDVEASVRTAEAVRHHFGHLKIFARVRNREHAHQLLDLGIEANYRETLATSLELTKDVLLDLGFKPEHAAETIRRFREHDEQMLKEQHAVYKDEQALIDYSNRSTQLLSELFRTDKK